MDDIKKPAPVVEKVNLEDVRKVELARINDIEAMGEQHGFKDQARSAIANGVSADDFAKDVLRKIGEAKPVVSSDTEVGLSSDEVREFSFMRAIHALANPTDRRWF